MNKQEIAPVGADLKYQLNLATNDPEHDIDDLEFTVSVTDGVNTLDFCAEITESAGEDPVRVWPTGLRPVQDNPGVFILAVPTSSFRRGELTLKVSTRIPDSDFADGYRNESVEIPLGITLI